MKNSPSIFISTTSADLHAARDIVAKVLSSMGFNPVWQDIAATDAGELIDVLIERIKPCDAILQLVGHRYGAEPPDPHPVHGRVSYTQFEALHSESIGKKVIYIMLPDDFPVAACSPEKSELVDLQETYRSNLQKRGVLHHTANNTIELENRVYRVRNELQELRLAIERNRKRMLQISTAALILLLLITTIILQIRLSSIRQEKRLGQVEASNTRQEAGIDILQERGLEQAETVARIEERVKEIRSLPTQEKKALLTTALAAANTEDLNLLSKAGLKPREVEIALGLTLPGSKKNVARQFFESSKREPEAIDWLVSVLAKGVNPNLCLPHYYYEQEAIIVSALAAGNAKAVIALINAGASAHPFQELWLTKYSIPRFLHPFNYLKSNSKFSAEEKKAIADAYLKAGVCKITLQVPKNGFGNYFGQTSAVAKSHESAEKLWGIEFSSPDDSKPITGEIVALNAKKLTGHDWPSLFRKIPKHFVLDKDKTGRCTYFEEIKIQHLIGIYHEKAYFLAWVNNRFGRYALVEVSKSLDLWSIHIFTPNGAGLGFAKKERDDEIDPDRAWRKFDITFEPSNKTLLLKDYYHFKVKSSD